MSMTIDEIFQLLKDEFGLKGATGHITFNLKDFGIVVKQNSVVGNIIEEWLSEWFNKMNIPNIHNTKQEAPDFWLNPNDLTKDLLEIKCFTKSPNFDIANFMSYVTEIPSKPYRLGSKYLLIKYFMDDEGLVTIEDLWLKNVWEICCPSEKRPIKVQEKKKVIYNIRPAIWYSQKKDYKTFESLEDFLAAIEQTLYDYSGTRSTLAEGWCNKICNSYKDYYGKEIVIPRWFDIKQKYVVL